MTTSITVSAPGASAMPTLFKAAVMPHTCQRIVVANLGGKTLLVFPGYSHDPFVLEDGKTVTIDVLNPGSPG